MPDGNGKPGVAEAEVRRIRMRRAAIDLLIGAVFSALSVLLLIEQVVPDAIAATPQHQAVIRADLTMMGMGGMERTAEEYRALLAESGWRLEGITPAGAAFSVIEARPA